MSQVYTLQKKQIPEIDAIDSIVMTTSGISPGEGGESHGRNGSHMTSIDPVETRNETQSCR